MQSLLFTGATGFLGRNILPLLRSRFAETVTLSRSPEADIVCDLATEIPVLVSRPDIVVHAAGKAHSVPRTDAEKQEYFSVNVEGTKNLCAALQRIGLPAEFVFISTVAVYGCETGNMIDETHPRNGTTPYARSKILAEDFISDWCARNGVKLTILRPALIAAPFPPANLGDMIRGIRSGRYADIGDGDTRRSLVAAADFAEIIPRIARIGGIYNVSNPDSVTYRRLSTMISEAIGKRPPIRIPLFAARMLATLGDAVDSLPGNVRRRLPAPPLTTLRLRKLTGNLTFSSSRLRRALPSFRPTPITSALLVKK